MERKLSNITVYNERMENGMKDKLYFLEYLPKGSTILDYGCANGALGKAIDLVRPDIVYIGYDNSEEMVALATQNYPRGFYFSDFFAAKEYLLELSQRDFDYSVKNAIVLSSVIHEVYSYAESEIDVTNFWTEVLDSRVSYIFIRDMALENDDIAFAPAPNISKFLTDYIERKGLQVPTVKNFKEYYQLWLKYWYTENWDRESYEDYFPVSLEQVKLRIKYQGSNYDIIDFHHIVHPYIRRKVQQDFAINPFIYNTHYTMVLKLQDC